VLESISTGIRHMQLHHAYMGLALLEFKNGVFTYASAGMPPLLVYRARTHTVEEIGIRSLFLGTHYKKPYTAQEIPVGPGDYLVMLSDGFTETRNQEGQMIAPEVLVEAVLACALQGSQSIINGLIELQKNFAQQDLLHDDCTALAIGRR
jgi:sigma-B regulation protein RsbU (phosphoserine phosphatase)